MLLLRGPEDLSFDPGPDRDVEHRHDALSAPDPRIHSLCDPSARSLASSSAHGSHAAGAPPGEDRCSPARPAGRAGEPAASTAAQRRHPGWCHARGSRDALGFLLWFIAWSAVLAALADASLRQHTEHFCGGWLGRARLVPGAVCPRGAEPAGALADEDNFWSGAAARHWAAETYGFTLQASTPHLPRAQGHTRVVCNAEEALLWHVPGREARWSLLAATNVCLSGRRAHQGVIVLWNALQVARCAAPTAQADDFEPNIGLHWYLAAQLHDARAPGLQGLRGPTRALLHALAGARLAACAPHLGSQVSRSAANPSWCAPGRHAAS